MDLANQAGLFAITVATGIGLGVLFDVYRIIRTRCRFRTILTYIGDFFYWIIATCIAFGMLLAGNGGELRFYVFMGLLSGAVCYFRFISCYVIKNIIKILHVAGVLVKYLLLIWQSMIVKPVRWIFRIVFLPFNFTWRALRTLNNKLSTFKPTKK